MPARRILESIQDHRALAMILSNLAAAAINLGQADDALEYLDQSIDINRETQSKRDLLYPLLNKAGTLIVLKEYEEAEIVATEAVQLAREINHHMLEAIACITLADVSLVKKLPANAGEWLLQALAVTTPDEGTRAYAEIGWLLAHAMAQQERYSEAAAMLAKSLSYAAENDVVVEETARERVEEVEHMVNTHLPNVERERTAGEGWTTRQYLRNLQWFAQRVASRNAPASAPSPFVMVTVGEPDVDPGFTPREREIVQLLTQGYSTRSMADHLSVSPRTITTHIANIMAKMEVSSRAELVAKVMRSGQQ
jgi:DNA-binding CsgD family transcriptional regulator/Tfp pilus assembly protein PilF